MAASLFIELAGLAVATYQMEKYNTIFNSYRGKLDDLSSWLVTSASSNEGHYNTFRSSDPNFYNYYTSLPDYTICDSNVGRSKGRAFSRYGESLRRTLKTNRGFTPLTKVHLNNITSKNAVMDSAMTRATTYMDERRRVDSHILARWSAIVSAPVQVERYAAEVVNNNISSSFKSLSNAAQGYNSAGVLFGKSLYNITTSVNDLLKEN